MFQVIDAEYLTYLSLAKNNLEQLQYDTFDNLDDLTTLILSNNSLSRVTDDIFEWNPTKLEVKTFFTVLSGDIKYIYIYF